MTITVIADEFRYLKKLTVRFGFHLVLCSYLFIPCYLDFRMDFPDVAYIREAKEWDEDSAIICLQQHGPEQHGNELTTRRNSRSRTSASNIYYENRKRP